MSEVLGFGYYPEKTGHLFLVHLPGKKDADAEAAITEEFHGLEKALPWEQKTGGLNSPDLKVLLPLRLWNDIAEEARAEFNRRLTKLARPSGKWPKSGAHPLDARLGKELVLLCWAVEDADPLLIPNALRNWLGLAPEERWWLYTMTNAATGQALSGRNKGWRKAVRFALTENPVTEGILNKRRRHSELPLFGDLE